MNKRQIFKKCGLIPPKIGREYRRFQYGFTLTELVVVIGLIGLMSGGVIFNIGAERQNSALLRSAQRLSLDLRRAQFFTLSSKDFKAAGVPCGWGVHFNGLNSTGYVIFADLATAQNCSDRDFMRKTGDTSEDFETGNFETGITVKSLSGNLSDVVFTAPEPTVNFIPDQMSASIVLTNRSGATRTININKTGYISSP